MEQEPFLVRQDLGRMQQPDHGFARLPQFIGAIAQHLGAAR